MTFKLFAEYGLFCITESQVENLNAIYGQLFSFKYTTNWNTLLCRMVVKSAQELYYWRGTLCLNVKVMVTDRQFCN